MASLNKKFHQKLNIEEQTVFDDMNELDIQYLSDLYEINPAVYDEFFTDYDMYCERHTYIEEHKCSSFEEFISLLSEDGYFWNDKYINEL